MFKKRIQVCDIPWVRFTIAQTSTKHSGRGRLRLKTRTLVVLAECICVDSIKATYSEEFITLNKVLPFALQNEHILLVVPTHLSHVGQDISMWFDDYMDGWGRMTMGLKESVDL